MKMERRALYNLLRLNWLDDPSMAVEDWQVEDYRLLSIEELFRCVKELGISLSKESFLAYAEECDTPEDLAALIIDEEVEKEDRLYLLLFELWRLLLPEKQSLSIFCDELDRLIYNWDEEPERLQDAIAYLQEVLEENVDGGVDPKEVMARLSAFLANDLESFLYDFIVGQIEEENESYSLDLLEGFLPYVSDRKWFRLLEIRLMADPEEAGDALEELLKELDAEPDLDLLLEVIHYMAHVGDEVRFCFLVRRVLPLLEVEGDLVELLRHCVQVESCCEAVEKLLFGRDRDLAAPLPDGDPTIKKLENIITICAEGDNLNSRKM